MTDTFVSAKEFQTLIEGLYQRASNLEQPELEDFAAAEGYIQQSYEGRSLFELIQNGRDAAYLAHQPGLLDIELVERSTGYWLLVRNSGKPFTPAGVTGLTRIGQSTKADAHTIGFKGIGFKAVKQLTDTPRVVTQWGTLCFDLALTRSRFLAQRGKGAPEKYPLFRLPHYATERLTPTERANGIVTRVELPLRNEEAQGLVEDDLAGLTARQLVLLGMVRQLTIRTPAATIEYVFKSQAAGRLEVICNGEVTEQYRVFEPERAIIFPKELLNSVSAEEKAIMERMTRIDIRLLLLLDKRHRFEAQEDAPLYLFYPLRLRSGFGFLIHSFFLVDPARTTLRPKCRANEFLLQQIGGFIGGELLAKLIAGGYDTTEILHYRRRDNPELQLLYNEVQQRLRNAAFIRLTRGNKVPQYLRPSEVMCAAPGLVKLLPSGRVGERQLVPVADATVRRWLNKEFDVPELTSSNLGEQLELECIRQGQANNIAFFQQLYQFLATDKTLELKSHRVLLTQQLKVVAGGHETVFFRTTATTKINLARPLQRKLHLLHSGLALTESQLQALEAHTGLQELMPEALAEQLLDLMADEDLKALRAPILRALKDLAQDREQAHTWFPRVLLPVQDGRWVLPLQQPVYIDRPELRELYPDGVFVDRGGSEQLDGEAAEWNTFFLQVGAWDKPGLYINPKPQALLGDDPRNTRIRQWKWWNTSLFLLQDRVLHVPDRPTAWFTQQILIHWPSYHSWLVKTHSDPLFVSSEQSSQWHQAPAEYVPEWCGAVQWLRTAAWVVLPGQPVQTIPQLVGIAPGNTRMRLAENFLPVWRLDTEQHQAFIAAMRLNHLNAKHMSGQSGITMMQHVLQLTHDLHPDLTKVPASEFDAFYSTLLRRLQDYWEEIGSTEEQRESLEPFRKLQWLAREEGSGQLKWQQASKVLYLDDRPAYEQLLRDLLTHPSVAAQLPVSFYYHFTKWDAQGFGRLAQHIGQRFTKLVKRTLQLVPEEEPEPLLTSHIINPNLLLRLVALMEGQRNRQFILSDLARLRAARLVCCSNLVVTFKLAFTGRNSMEFELEQPHFLERAGRSSRSNILYVQHTLVPSEQAQIQRNIADALVMLLSQALEASGQYLRQTLPNLLVAVSRQDLEEFDALYSLSPDRLAELRAELYPPLETPEVLFWLAVRQGLGLPAISSTSAASRPAPMTALLKGIQFQPNSQLTREIAEAFVDGALQQQETTRALLGRLLQEIGLSVSELNAQLPQPLHFTQLLESEWQLALERYKPQFEGRLHAGLAGEPINQQGQYLQCVRRYEQLSRPALLNEWHPDHNAYLHALCASEFKNQLALAPLPPPQDHMTQSKRTLEALRRRFGVTPVGAEQLDAFLQLLTRRSLLFFGHKAHLASEFEKWQRKRQTIETNTNPTANALPPVNPVGFGQSVGQMTAPPVSAPRARITSGGTGGAAGGRETQQARDHIGRRAEERVWVWLQDQGYRNVMWVSANAQRVAVEHPAYNLRGSDEHHYDLHYTDEAGEQVYVEVKGTSGTSLEFYMSQWEVEFAESQPPGRYRLFFVTQALDDQRCDLHPFFNPFQYAGLESRWHNSRFRAEADTLRLSFALKA